MAAKTRNPDRKNGKAWSNAHNLTVGETQAAQDRAVRRAEKKRVRESRVVRHEKGSYVTMPEIDWDWFENIMASRWPHTHRVRTIDAHISWSRSTDKPAVEMDVVVVANSETKQPSGARPSKKAVSKANAAARRDGRK